MKKIQLDLVSEFIEKSKTNNGEILESLKAFKMNVVGNGEVVGNVEVSEGGHFFMQMSTGLAPELIKRVILKLTQGGTIELPDMPEE